MPVIYDYRIDEDNTGGKPKWWVVRFPVESGVANQTQAQRLSRYDAPQQAADKIIELKQRGS